MQQIVSSRDVITDDMVGGKFSRQSDMIVAGVPVPEFFCLSVSFFEDIFKAFKPEVESILSAIDFTKHASVKGASESVQRLFTSLELDNELQNTILNAFDNAFAADQLVSVRASTVGHLLEESEDSVSNPFAGMSESFLYVPRDQICDKVKACWGSGFSQESLIYRQAQGMSLLGFSVAVGVQKMVFGERSFVLFTADPKTAARDQVIVAGHGIGEGVVQERVPVDHYFVNGKTSDIRKEIANKETQLTIDEAAGFGLCETSVEESMRETPCLNDTQILQLVDMGKKIEALFGLPQDIEGTFTPDGQLSILQSRPIALDYGRQLIWTNTNVTESFPGVSTPLTYTFAKYFYRVIFYDAYRRLGVKESVIMNNFQPLDKMIGYLNGRIYYCLSHFYLLHKQSPMYPLFAAHWENMIGLSSSYQTHNEGGALFQVWDKVKKWTRVGTNAVATVFDYLNHDRSMYRYHSWWENLIAPKRGKSFKGEDPLTLVNLFHKVWGEVGDEWGVTLTTDGYLIPIYGFAETLFKKWELNEDPGLLSDCLCGGETLSSVEIILSAVNLAEMVRNNPVLSSAFKDNTDKKLWQMAEQNKLDQAFTEQLKKHLHFYGDRGLQELKLEQPGLRDTPWVLLRMIKQYAIQDVTVASMREQESSVRAKADINLDGLLVEKPFRRFVLQRVILPRLRRLIMHRENSRYCRSELYGFSKNIFSGLADYFVERGVLKKTDDIFYLTQDEVFGYIDGTGVTENLQVLADLRRKEHKANLSKDVATNVTSLGAIRDNTLTPQTESIDYDPNVLQGLGSSAGKVQGIARVIDDPNEAGDIDPSMILIARETDPGWLFLMLASKGMVVERGSMLSHTAITGRKFGIPTIVALPDATQRIPDGALIEIDGSAGIVTIIDAAPKAKVVTKAKAAPKAKVVTKAKAAPKAKADPKVETPKND
ncbi:MAG: phosphohistidine swiveling domain-containing protein [Oleiphilaceae bacterium]